MITLKFEEPPCNECECCMKYIEAFSRMELMKNEF